MTDPRSKDLIKLRGSIKGKLTIFQNFLNSLESIININETQFNELESRLNKIDCLHNDFDKFQTELEMLSDDPEQLISEREEFENKYFALVSAARTMMNKYQRDRQRTMSMSESSDGGIDREVMCRDFVRLPKIAIPEFSGKFREWLNFRDTYISIIHSSNQLGDINKFHYLKSALKGSALLIIQNLEFTAKNYAIAWQLLSNRYDNERLLVNQHMNDLLNTEIIQRESCHALRSLVDNINTSLCALNSLGQPTDHWDTIVIHLMIRKLDNTTFREWEQQRNAITTSPTLKQFLDFLTNRADLLETIQQQEYQRHLTTQNLQQNQQQFTTKHFQQNQHTQHSDILKNSNIVKANYTENRRILCPLCKQKHFLYLCEDFKKLDVDSRIEKVENFNICKNCLRPGHREYYCNLSHCKYCSKMHNTLLHKDIESLKTVALSSNIKTDNNKPYVLLSTALVNVVASDGSLHPARLLLDNASTAHFVTSHLCDRLGLTRRHVNSSVTGINNQISFSAESCNLSIESRTADYRINLNCYVLPHITNSLPPSNVDINSIQLPPNIQLADPSFHMSSPIDILVGADVFWDVIGCNFINLGEQRPKLQETQFGWLVSGTVTKHKIIDPKNLDQSSCFFSQINDLSLTRFWELESINSKYSLSPEEQACEKHFVENTRREVDGRFVVTIPLKESPEVLGDSYQIAKGRLLSLERRFLRDSVLKNRYLDFMIEYERLGHMSDISTLPKQIESQSHSNYLVHHGVTRESSSTTKLRVVFNASNPTSKGGKTFNSIQMVGPVVQDDLLSILLRFRQYKYVVSADIEKMYRAILINPSQRSLQKILFRYHPGDEIRTFT
ncbi:PREDICTED: uncharacterized protein LOC106111033, partial [Papilio polytes]|uniref:uncharacterized protein LOC106111033 n=1 Tax=Papilio polytes TaxID=76194 RepID=UPI000676275F